MNDIVLRAGHHYQRLLEIGTRTFKSPDFRQIRSPDFDLKSSKIKMLAYYLPQFHPIPENDRWWGKGFTEWTNVTRALPQFEDHYQPQIPADLGFYDLRNEKSIEDQVDLARMYGIHGFIIYHYWFNGRKILDSPIETLIKRTDIDFPFAICWANENWTRRWDGQDQEILMAQKHSTDSDRRFIEHTLRYMRDPRYIRINGRPLLIVYRVGLFEDPAETAERWRYIAREQLGEELFLVYVLGFGLDKVPAELNFDAAIQFPPHALDAADITADVRPFTDHYEGRVYSYTSFLQSARARFADTRYPLIPGTMPAWDNTARRGANGSCVLGATPDRYASWLTEAALFALDHPVMGESFVAINAWNEWAEGAHLEPDQRYGHAFLRATAEVHRPYCSIAGQVSARDRVPVTVALPCNLSKGRRTAVVIHAYYADTLETILQKLSFMDREDIFISVPNANNAPILRTIVRHFEPPHIYLVENRGRDVRPFLRIMRDVDARGYDYFVKVHTKRSSHRGDGDKWNDELIAPLAHILKSGDLERVLDSRAEIGLVGAKEHILDGESFMGSAGNLAWLRVLAHLFGRELTQPYGFIAGTMFAGRVSALRELFLDEDLPFRFEEEQSQLDGTLAHALERFFSMFVMRNAQQIVAIDKGPDGTFRISDQDTSPIINYDYAAVHCRKLTLGPVG